MNYDTSYLNQSQNKDRRNSSQITTGEPEFVVWHGTDSPNPSNTPATLEWAKINDGKRGAAHYYVAQSGLAYHYIDERDWIAYHAGAGGARARGYIGYQVNVHAIGVEIEERITRKPKIAATAESLETAAHIALDLHNIWNIPLERPYHLGHKEIVMPGYRYDPDSYSIDAILARARELGGVMAPIAVDPRFLSAYNLSGGVWKQNQLTPGLPLTNAYDYQGKIHQKFERAIARLDATNSISWLLLSEIEAMNQP